MNIYLRPLTENDYPLTMAWRSNPLVYQGFYSQKKPLEWEEHINWIHSRNQDWRNFIIMYNDRPVGVAIVCQLDHWSPEIGYYIGEVSLWGKGICTEAVRLLLQYVKNYGRDYCHTTILKSNKRALCLAEKLGFKKLGDARKGEIWLDLKLSAK